MFSRQWRFYGCNAALIASVSTGCCDTGGAPVQFVLLLFGFANTGVPFEQIGPGRYYLLAGLLLGKPIYIVLFWNPARLAGPSLPPGLHLGDLMIVGVAASIGITVKLFFATAAFPGGVALAEAKMGAYAVSSQPAGYTRCTHGRGVRSLANGSSIRHA
jgi:Na+/H+ antiporter NhaA